ncbi:uncharacterized protein LOC124199707 [Daphnia pulex]|uniref:uncharacterized protein LOC124199707 n=1 Tax=Daphnia pulex TaxID=6669 RepID=UPI001EDF5AC6|nr:uncharacterized protein LOC124199707 [Daphnia pulex]
MDYVEEVECKPNKVYDFYADIKVHIEDGGVIMKEGVPLKADCYERMLREVHFYRKMNMAKKYTHRYSDFTHQGKKLICEQDFLDAMKNGNRPTFTIDAYVYLQDNTVGWLRFIPQEMKHTYYVDDY